MRGIRRKNNRGGSIFGRAAGWLGKMLLLLFVSSVAAVAVLRFVPVYCTPLMLIRLYEQTREGREPKWLHVWTPLEEMANALALAVVASEDNRFLAHGGFDLEQIGKARDEARAGKRVRGASTISQQTAKNVFLWPGKTYLRKGMEAYFTLLIEWIWGKERIMEVYLNSIETGDGLYGMEAAARTHFGKHASEVSRAEAALIAASLPNPRRFSPSGPSPYLLRRQQQIMRLMDRVGVIDMGCRR